MKEHAVSIAEGKKSFSRLIDGAIDKKEEVIVTRRGKPIAVIIPYEEYIQSRRRGAWLKILEVRGAFKMVGVDANEIVKASREELEGRS